MGPPLSVGLMGWGTSYDDESTDFVMDEMDRLTPRDLSVARFRKNHELMETIFDHRKIADLQPDQSSPYANLSAATLRAQLKVSEESTQEMQKSHVERLRLIKMDRRGGQEEEAAQDGEDGDTPAWARNASKGKVLNEAGYPYARAPTPEFLKKRVDEQRRIDEEESRKRQEQEQQAAAAAAQAQQQQPQPQPQASQAASTDVKMDEASASQTVDQDADADADADDDDADADADADEDEDGDQDTTESKTDVPATTTTAVDAAVSPETQRRAEEIEAITKSNERLGVDGAADAIEIVQNNDTAAPPSEQAATSTLVEPATLNTESANVTHPLSAEAEAASNEPSGFGGAAETKEATADQEGPATSAMMTETQEPPPVEMKAPTPPLNENAGENDAPKEL